MQNYKINYGDTLGGIAKKSGVDVGSLAKENNIADPNKIYAGKNLVIPSNPSASNPVATSPAAQAYIQSQVSPATQVAPQQALQSASSRAKEDYITAYKSYLDSQKNNQEVSEAKKYLTKLVLDDRMAREKARNSGETMGFAGGEEARVARNNAFAIDSATSNLGLLQDLFNADTARAKTNTDFARDLYGIETDIEKENRALEKERLQNERQMNPAFELSAGQERYQYDPATKSYKVIASKPKDTSQVVPKGSTQSGGLVYTPDDAYEDSQALESSRGADGYVDPAIYQKLYQAWIDEGGLLKDFLLKYPPKNYVNPLNKWLPPYLMPTKTGSTRAR